MTADLLRVAMLGTSQHKGNLSYTLPRNMKHFYFFRRFLLLVLSLTLTAQSMAVASLGACHKANALALLSAQLNVSASHRHHQNVSSQLDSTRGYSEHVAVPAHGQDSDDDSTRDGSRAKCAACAACHLCSVILTSASITADTPMGGSVSFPESIVPRARNVANGLERPPRA